MASVNLNIELPVDQEGFLRRECPYCNREFKMLFKSANKVNLSDIEITEKLADDNKEFYCPYCGQSADQNSFWTKDQIRYVHEIANQKVLQPMLDDFGKDIEKISRKNDFIKFKVERKQAKKPVISPEPNDMSMLESQCCSEKIKVEEGWEGFIYCVICGKKIEKSSK